ncbi:MAG: aldehyde dehydrogenase family protein [Bacteroidales bacterium]
MMPSRSNAWKFLEQQFEQAYAAKDSIETKPHRQQDRRKPYIPMTTASIATSGTTTARLEEASTAAKRTARLEEASKVTEQFVNEPDTDFDLTANQQWAKELVARWKKPADHKPEIIPLQIGDKRIIHEQRCCYYDQSQVEAPALYEMCRANADQVREALALAEADPQAWRKTSLEERHRILHAAADRLAAMRGELIGCMAAVTGKCFIEADVEVSEAVDYARYYSISMKTFAGLEDVEITPKGTVLVISPWNFPCAIPVGGIVAALAGGNTCLLKPATAAAPVAWMLAQAFWEAGLPKSVLQVLITDREALGVLTTAPAVKHIILTGGTDTARFIAQGNPSTPLSAETGGKNAIILTASGDRDHAIKSVVRSAFGNSGQKCSACSLLLVEQSVYNDPAFREKLCDATLSMKTGSVWELGNAVGPMITNQNEKLQRALQLDQCEEWLVPPRFLDKQQYIMAPAVKWGVRPGSFTFTTELFAPLLAVTPIKNLQEGIRLVNESDYGLTSGLQSLDENEQALWKAQLKAGNLYINRGITGAIVHRQPFGGMKLSAFGGGIKAGGPNYCSCFVKFSDKPEVKTSYKESYKQAYEQEFSRPRDVNNLYGEQNIFRYLPLENMVLRLFPQDSLEQVEMIVYAAELCKTPLTLSLDPKDPKASKLLFMGLKPQKECLEAFTESMGAYERIRTCSPDLPLDLYQAAARADKYIACSAPVREGRVELLHYIREQSLSFEYHRYGSISRIPPLS